MTSTAVMYEAVRDDTLVGVVNATRSLFSSQTQYLAFVHGTGVGGELAPRLPRDMDLDEAVMMAKSERTGNVVTSALQDSDEFAFGALLSIYAYRRSEHV